MWLLREGRWLMTKADCLTLLVALLNFPVACGQTQVGQGRDKSAAAAASPASSTQKIYPGLKAQAELWAEAYVREDYVKVASLMNPKQVELAGGPERAASILAGNLKRYGARMLAIQVGEPDVVVSAEEQLFAIVPTELKMREPRGVVVGKGFLIGASNDGGETWTFVDGSGGRAEVMIKSLLPAAAGKLKLPELKPLELTAEP
jgi:hypothetical protein